MTDFHEIETPLFWFHSPSLKSKHHPFVAKHHPFVAKHHPFARDFPNKKGYMYVMVVASAGSSLSCLKSRKMGEIGASL